ncbi:class I SAM-dependent methyltransferase [Pseudomonas atacamensis]|uniref:Class I SAM-dependent methyltransferase n=1 Tax=Pseudomonas iranensis TaxID=2745503 RepID=A0AAU7ERD2_9PSED
MIVLDIGCGRKKITGAIGIDFSAMSDADILLDLNKEDLPFEDSSVDLIFSSHTLEHLTLEGFLHVMQECYRVLKPLGQLKIVVPYFTTTANLANPFHNNNICFNEHTFRFFSSDTETDALPKQEYVSPSCPHWGLRYSANSEIGIEFKTLAMSYFYFPEYADATDSEKFLARSSKMNVVDQIAYSLETVKPCPVRPETGPVGASDDPFVFVEQQLEHIRHQVAYFETREVGESVLNAARRAVTAARVDGSIFSVDGVLTPVNFLIYELDVIIQDLRRKIDGLG